jgi:hypothetical protein
MATYSDPFTFDHPVVKAIIERLTSTKTRCTPAHIEAAPKVLAIAEWYATQYNGTYPFMVDMHRTMSTRSSLTPKQAAGTINCMVNDYQYQQKKQAEIQERVASSLFKMPEADLPADLGATNKIVTALDKAVTTLTPDTILEPVTPVVLNGTYTIVLDETGDYRTLRLVDAPAHYAKHAGTQIAQYLSGNDNESAYSGFAFVAGDKISVWSKFRADSKLSKALQVLLAADRASQIDLGEAYALSSGNCFRCGIKLTVPASLARGLGPICAEKFGISIAEPKPAKKSRKPSQKALQAAEQAAKDLNDCF